MSALPLLDKDKADSVFLRWRWGSGISDGETGLSGAVILGVSLVLRRFELSSVGSTSTRVASDHPRAGRYFWVASSVADVSTSRAGAAGASGARVAGFSMAA